MSNEAIFAGCAAHSMAGRSDKVKKFDGVENREVLTFSRVMPGLSVAKVLAGNSACHFFLLGMDGNAYAFGRNEDGQLGFGDEVNRYQPTRVPLPEKAGSIVGGACGPSQSFLFNADGEMYSCGINTAGQLGIGKITVEPVRTFSRVVLEGKCVSVACGKDFSICCTTSGDAYSWGSPENGQLGNGTEGKSLEKAGKFTFAYRSTPGKIEGLDKVDPTSGIVQVACGLSHAMVMDVEGRIFTWGFGGYGRLGHGDAKDRYKPEAVQAFCNVPPPPNPNIPAFAQRVIPKLRAKKIACGQTCCYAICGEPFFSLYFWGITKKSGEATLRPTIFEALQGCKVLDVACGVSSTVVTLDDDTVVSWGPSPTYGELGYGDGKPKSSTKPLEIEYLKNIKLQPMNSVAAGYAATLVLVDTNDAESKKLLEGLPVLDTSGGEGAVDAAAAASTAAAAKKREAADAKSAEPKKAKKKA